jgi:[ribosomal protein S5]-alanine N-acetyltransferase
MATIPVLDTERLQLRPFSLADAADVQRLAGDFAIADTTLNIPHPYQDGMAEAWIRSHPGQFNAGVGVPLAIARKADGALLGAISLMRIAYRHQGELGYWIGKPFWGQGYCSEAGAAVLRYAFGELGLIRVHARHLTRNPASGRVLQKLGFSYEGTLRQHVRKWEQFEDLALYGLLKD